MTIEEVIELLFEAPDLKAELRINNPCHHGCGPCGFGRSDIEDIYHDRGFRGESIIEMRRGS